MEIIKHHLYQANQKPYPFQASPNVGGQLKARYLIMHYTVFNTVEQTIATLTDPKIQASAHLIIGRNGEIVQLVPFNQVAWHAGKSTWQNMDNLNQHAIGIELVNVGYVTRTQSGKWLSWFGDEIDERQLVEMKHKNSDQFQHWEIYSDLQLSTALTVSRLLIQIYDLKDILGHDDIAPNRKTDPGPAFPMTDFRAKLFDFER